MHTYMHTNMNTYMYVSVLLLPHISVFCLGINFFFSDIPLKDQRMSVTSYLILCKLISYSTTNIPQYFVILNPTLGEINDLQS